MANVGDNAGGTNVGDKFFVPGTIENDDHEVFNVAVEALGNGFQVVGDGSIEINGTFATGADNDFFHVQIGSVEQAAALADGKDGNGIGSAGSTKIRAFEWIDGDVHGREK